MLTASGTGARLVRAQVPDAVSIFILPPSRAELERRLRARASDSEATIQRRLADARQDLQHAAEFDYIVVNDDFDVALAALSEIVKARREGCAIASERPTGLLHELLRT